MKTLIILARWLFVFLALLLIAACSSASDHWVILEILNYSKSSQDVQDSSTACSCGVQEQKTVSCVAGTSSGISAQIGGEALFQLPIAQVGISPSIARSVGLDSGGGESIELPISPSGSCIQYSFVKRYSLVSGTARVRASNGQEYKPDFTFAGSCQIVDLRQNQTSLCSGNTKAVIPSTIQPAPITAIPPPTLRPIQPTLSLPPTKTLIPRTDAPYAVFFDDFDTLDHSQWTIANTQNYVSITNSSLELSANQSRFPYLFTASNPFPLSGDFRFNVSFRYSQVDVCGVGIMLQSFRVPAGLSQDSANAFQELQEANGLTIGTWQDIKNGMYIWYRSKSDRPNKFVSGENQSWHDFKVEYTNQSYKLFMDGALHYTSPPTLYRPTTIWIGNHVNLGAGHPCAWDTLQVDSIKIESLP